MNWINYHNRHKLSVWLSVFAVFKRCIYRGFLFVFFFTVIWLEIWATGYVCVVHNSKEAASEGRQWRQPLTQATTERNRAAGKGGWRWLGTQSRSLTNIVPPQGRENNMNNDDIISQGVPFRGCFADCYMTIVRMFTAMLVSIIKNWLLIYPPDFTRIFWE